MKIFWTYTATKQRFDIFRYWKKRNGSNEYSRKVRKQIKEREKVLLMNPKIGKVTDFPDTYAIPMGHFSIFYKQFESKIIITAFWDNRQDPDKLVGILK